MLVKYSEGTWKSEKEVHQQLIYFTGIHLDNKPNVTVARKTFFGGHQIQFNKIAVYSCRKVKANSTKSTERILNMYIKEVRTADTNQYPVVGKVQRPRETQTWDTDSCLKNK